MGHLPCSSCDQMKRENKQLRLNREEIHKNYVEVVNENLRLRREIDVINQTNLKEAVKKQREPGPDDRSPWYGLPVCHHGYQCCSICNGG